MKLEWVTVEFNVEMGLHVSKDLPLRGFMIAQESFRDAFAEAFESDGRSGENVQTRLDRTEIARRDRATNPRREVSSRRVYSTRDCERISVRDPCTRDPTAFPSAAVVIVLSRVINQSIMKRIDVSINE